MRFRDYFKDRIYSLVIFIVLLAAAVLLMRAYRLEAEAVAAVAVILQYFMYQSFL